MSFKSIKYLFFTAFIFIFINSQNTLSAKNKRIESVPFRLVGSYILVDVKINDSPPLSFILDTGVKTSILIDLTASDSILFSGGDSTIVQGLGVGEGVRALHIENNLFELGKLKFEKAELIVLLDEVFNLSNITGEKINGILGSDILKDYLVEINYRTSRINFFNHNAFLIPQKYISIPTLLVKSKLYVNVDIVNNDASFQKVVMLLDTGAEVGAWLQNMKEGGVKMPEKNVFGYIGEGLNGEIHGHFAYVNSLCIGPFCIKKPIVTFPDSIYINKLVLNSGRDGTLGNQVLKRFDIILDYKTPALYLRPNFMFSDKFSYNIAGIELIQDYLNFFDKRVNKVWKNSPAEKKGIKLNDLILEVDKQPAYSLKLTEIRKIFETPRQLPLHLVIARGGEVIDIFLDMRSPI